MTDNRASRSLLPYILLAGAGSALPFIPVIRWGFLNLDDTVLVVENPVIRSLGITAIWDMLTSFSLGRYHPLVLFMHACELECGGPDPVIFHATNLFLHAANTVLAGILLHHFFKDRVVLMVTLLFFALHPLRVEPVAWISARHDLLSTSWILVSVILFLHYRKHRTRMLLVWSFLAAVLASLSSATAAVIPALMILVRSSLPARSLAHDERHLVPFWVLAVLTCIVAAAAQYASEGYIIDPDHSLIRAMTLPFWIIVFTVWKTMIPSGLTAAYPFPEHGGPDLLLPSALSLIAISVAAIVLMIRKPDKRIMFGIGWFLVCLAPVIQVFSGGGSFTADRLTYLPAIGLSMIAGVIFEQIISRKKGAYRPLVWRAAIVGLAVLGTLSYVRTDVWRNSVSLWTDVIDRYPSYAEGYAYLGSALAAEERNIPLAIEAFSEAIRLDDRDPHAYRNRALALYQSGSSDTARIISDLSTAIMLDPQNADHQIFLAEIYLAYGRPERSLEMCSALLDANPALHKARLLRIRAAYALGRGEIVTEDVRILGQAGIDISIERNPEDGQRF